MPFCISNTTAHQSSKPGISVARDRDHASTINGDDILLYQDLDVCYLSMSLLHTKCETYGFNEGVHIYQLLGRCLPIHVSDG